MTSTTLTIKKETQASDLPWLVFNEHGKTVARFRDHDDAKQFLYYGQVG